MADALTRDGIKYMIARLQENANEAVEESKENKDDAYCAGRKVAYYEMLDIPLFRYLIASPKENVASPPS